MNSYQRLRERLEQAFSDIEDLREEVQDLELENEGLREKLDELSEQTWSADQDLIRELLLAGHSGHWVSCPICDRQCIVSRLRQGVAA